MAGFKGRVDCRERVIAAANHSKMRELADWGCDFQSLGLNFRGTLFGTQEGQHNLVVPGDLYMAIIDEDESVYSVEELNTGGERDRERESGDEISSDDAILVPRRLQ
jgi:hypothetical protein